MEPEEGRADRKRGRPYTGRLPDMDFRAYLPWLLPAEKDRHDTLVLTPRVVTIGIGCRKGKSADAVSEALRRVLAEEQIPKEALVGIASMI